MITIDQAINRAMALYDRHQIDCERRFITDALVAGRSDDEIEAACQVAREIQAEHRPQFMRQMIADTVQAAFELSRTPERGRPQD